MPDSSVALTGTPAARTGASAAGDTAAAARRSSAAAAGASTTPVGAGRSGDGGATLGGPILQGEEHTGRQRSGLCSRGYAQHERGRCQRWGARRRGERRWAPPRQQRRRLRPDPSLCASRAAQGGAEQAAEARKGSEWGSSSERSDAGFGRRVSPAPRAKRSIGHNLRLAAHLCACPRRGRRPPQSTRCPPRLRSPRSAEVGGVRVSHAEGYPRAGGSGDGGLHFLLCTPPGCPPPLVCYASGPSWGSQGT